MGERRIALVDLGHLRRRPHRRRTQPERDQLERGAIVQPTRNVLAATGAGKLDERTRMLVDRDAREVGFDRMLPTGWTAEDELNGRSFLRGLLPLSSPLGPRRVAPGTRRIQGE